MAYTRTVTQIRPNTSVEWFKPTQTANVYAANGFISIGSNTSADELTKIHFTTFDTEINAYKFFVSINTNPTPMQQTLDYLIDNPGFIMFMSETVSNT